MTTTIWPSSSGSRRVGIAVVAMVMIPPEAISIGFFERSRHVNCGNRRAWRAPMKRRLIARDTACVRAQDGRQRITDASYSQGFDVCAVLAGCGVKHVAIGMIKRLGTRLRDGFLTMTKFLLVATIASLSIVNAGFPWAQCSSF
jgi:hypothetical protein